MCAFLPWRSPGLQKVSKKQNYWWQVRIGRIICHTASKFSHQAVKDEKCTKMTERAAGIG
jgi:hypothetical protein